MNKAIIAQSDKAIICHITGIDKFKGCQCHGDCSCKEDFKPSELNYYSVTRIGKNRLFYETLDQAYKRFNFINSL